MSRMADVYVHERLAGRLVEDEDGTVFKYDSAYLTFKKAAPVSVTLPLQSEPFHDKVLFPFFDGLIPEGWLLSIAEDNWKLNRADRMGLLLACCRDCIGAVSVREVGT